MSVRDNCFKEISCPLACRSSDSRLHFVACQSRLPARPGIGTLPRNRGQADRHALHEGRRNPGVLPCAAQRRRSEPASRPPWAAERAAVQAPQAGRAWWRRPAAFGRRAGCRQGEITDRTGQISRSDCRTRSSGETGSEVRLCLCLARHRQSPDGTIQRGDAGLNEALKLDPRNAFALGQRGYTYFALRDNGKGLADVNAALEIDNTAAAPYAFRGMIYSDMGDRTKPLPT